MLLSGMEILGGGFVGLGSKSGGSESRFADYVEAITSVLGHADRVVPLQLYLRDFCCQAIERMSSR